MSCASLLWAGPSPSRPEYTRINIRVSPKQWGNDREITVGVRGAVVAKLHYVAEALCFKPSWGGTAAGGLGGRRARAAAARRASGGSDDDDEEALVIVRGAERGALD